MMTSPSISMVIRTTATTLVGQNLSWNYTIHNDSCSPSPEYAPMIPIKMVLVGVVGTSIAFFSLAQNSLLLHVFLKKEGFRYTHYYYMLVLSIFDIYLAVSYLLLLTVQIFAEYFQSYFLSLLWHLYVRPMLALSNVATTITTLLIVTATVERYLISTRKLKQSRMSIRKRGAAASLAIVLGFVLKGTTYWECDVTVNYSCSNNNRFGIKLSALAHDESYKSFWMFWIRNITTVFVPFFFLLIFNFFILKTLKGEDPTPHIRAAFLRQPLPRGFRVKDAVAKRNANIQIAARTLTFIVASYLTANAFNVVLTFWEHINQENLFAHRQFYTLSADVVSLLTLISGAMRLEIYGACNPAIREEAWKVFRYWSHSLRRLWCQYKSFDRGIAFELV